MPRAGIAPALGLLKPGTDDPVRSRAVEPGPNIKVKCMNGFRKASTLLLGAALGAAGAISLQPRPATAETETGDRPEIIVPRAGGRAAFEKFGCITCHLGDGRGGQNEGGYGADLRVTKLTEEELVQTIANGRAGKGMPAFKGLIDDETLGVLAKYIKEELRLR